MPVFMLELKVDDKGAVTGVKHLNQIGAAASSTEKEVRSLEQSLKSAAQSVLALVGAYKAIGAMKGFVQRGLEFNSSIESSRIGIASLITSMVKLEDAQGKTLEGAEKYAAAQEIAADMMKEIQRLGLETTATTQELVQGVQTIMGPAVQAGMALKDIPKFAVAGAQAMQTMGIPLNQMRTEIEALLTGNINKAQDLLAPRLGITKDVLNSWKEQGTLVENLMKKLEAFQLAGQDVAQTWRGLVSNLDEAMDVLAGQTSSGFAESLKQSVRELQNLIIDTKEGSVGISVDFENIAELLLKIESSVGQGILAATKALVSGLKSLNAAIGERGVVAFFDDLESGAIAAVAAIAALTVARKASHAAWAQEVMGMKDGLSTLAKLGWQRLQNARAAKQEAAAQLDAASTALQEFRAKQQVAVVTGDTTAATLARNAVLKQEAALVSAVTAAQNRYAAASIKNQIVMKGLGAAFAGLGKVLGNVVSMFGGPMGIALTAATAGLTYLAARESDAERAARLHAEAMKGLEGALKDTGAEIDAFTEKLDKMSQAELEMANRKLKDALGSGINAFGEQVDDIAEQLRELASQAVLDSSFEDMAGRVELLHGYREQLEGLFTAFRTEKMGADELRERLLALGNSLDAAGYKTVAKAVWNLADSGEFCASKLGLLQKQLSATDEALQKTTNGAREAAQANKQLAESIATLESLNAKEFKNLEEVIKWFDKRLGQTKTFTDAQEQLAQKTDQSALAFVREQEILAQTAVAAAVAKAAIEGVTDASKAEIDSAAQHLSAIASLREKIEKGMADLATGRVTKGRSDSSLENARQSIERLKEEIAELNGEAGKSGIQLHRKLDEIEKVGKAAKLGAAQIEELKMGYVEAFRTNAINEFNRELLHLRNDATALRELEIAETVAKWEEAFIGAGMSAEEARVKVGELKTALAEQDRLTEKEKARENLQVQADFYDQLREKSGQYGLGLEYVNKLIEQQAQAWKEAGIPQEYREQLAEILRLEASTDGWDGAKRAMQSYYADATNMGRQFEDFTSSTLTGLEDAFVDFTMTGKASFSDLANSMISDLVRVAYKAMVITPILQGLTGGNSGGGGLLGTILGGVVGGLGGGGSTGAASAISNFNPGFGAGLGLSFEADGGVFSGGDISDFSGGIVTRPTLFSYGRHFSAFAGGGGLMGEAGPEAILPLERGSNGRLGLAMSGMDDIMRQAQHGFAAESARYMKFITEQRQSIQPEITVNVINQTGQAMQARTQTSPNGQGGLNLDILLTQVEAGIVQRDVAGRSQLVNHLDRTRGLSRAGRLYR